MNKKQFIVLLVLVVVLGAAGLKVYQKNKASYQGGGRKTVGAKLLGELPVNDVAAIEIKGGTNQLDLVKKDNLWRVKQRHDYPANFGEISGFLLKAADLKAAQTEEIGPSHLGRYKLLPPGPATNTAVLVELRDASGKSIKSLLLGKTHMRKSDRPSPMGEMGESEGYPDGRYVMVGSDSKNVAVISDPLSNIEPKPEQWLNKDFFKVEKIRSIAVTQPVATNSWKVTRDTETATEWKLADAKPDEKLDSAKTSSFSYALNSPSFNDVLPGDTKPEELGLDKPTTITLETFDNFTYNIKVGTKTNDNVPMAITVTAQIPSERVAGKDEKPEDKTKLDKEFKEKQSKLQEKLAQDQAYGKWIYQVSSWSVDSVLKDRKDLLAEKKEEPKKDEKPATDSSDTKKPDDLMAPPAEPAPDKNK